MCFQVQLIWTEIFISSDPVLKKHLSRCGPGLGENRVKLVECFNCRRSSIKVNSDPTERSFKVDTEISVTASVSDLSDIILSYMVLK